MVIITSLRRELSWASCFFFWEPRYWMNSMDFWSTTALLTWTLLLSSPCCTTVHVVNTIGYLVTTRVGGLTMRNQLLQGVVALLDGIPSLLLGSRVGFSSDNNK